MKVILLSDLRHTGKRGDIVQVRPGFARNYLLPKRLAAAATAGNLRWFDDQREQFDAVHAAERTAASEVAAQIDSVKVTIAKRASESQTLYGSVTPAEVVEALKLKGFTVDRKHLDLAGGIKTLGSHEVRVHLHAEVVAQITVDVVPEA